MARQRVAIVVATGSQPSRFSNEWVSGTTAGGIKFL